MKRIFTLGVIFLSILLPVRVQPEVSIRAEAWPCYEPDYTNDIILMVGDTFYIDIIMSHNEYNNRMGFSMPFAFYSPDQSIENIVRIDNGCQDPAYCSVMRMNGMEPGYNSYFEAMNQLLGFSWNGNLPDTINYTTLSFSNGWPYSPFENTYLSFAFKSNEIGTFCIDSVDIPGGSTYDWLWGVPKPYFYGPYCWLVDTPKVEFSGYIKIFNSTFGRYEAMPNFTFAISAGAPPNGTVLGTGTTDANGYYSEYIPRTNSEIYYYVYTDQEPPLHPVYFYYPEYYSDEFWVASDAEISRTIDVSISVGNPNINEATSAALTIQRDAFTIDSIMLLYSVNVNKIEIRTFSGTDPSQWVPRDPQDPLILFNINLFQRQNICHEIGHQIYYQLNNNQIRPESPLFDGSSHDYDSVTDTIFAFDEGLAAFFHAISTDTSATNYSDCNIENNNWYSGPLGNNKIGEIVEGAIATSLYDLYDDEYTPIIHIADDDVQSPSDMMPIILNCFRNYASHSQKTFSMRLFAERLLRDQSAPWYGWGWFDDLRDDICDIFEFQYMTFVDPNNPKKLQEGDFCHPNDIHDNSDSPQLPWRFEIFQNYPNPFNSTTAIEFTLPGQSGCRLEIYNILGQIVFRKDLGTLDAGPNKVILEENTWGNQSSGIYYYRIIADNGTITKKMLLLK